MIREPYNINPYNATIDTSEDNNFNFVFSGDELGSWQVEVARNNTSLDTVYTGPRNFPGTGEHIFDGDEVSVSIPAYTTSPSVDGIPVGEDYIWRVKLREPEVQEPENSSTWVPSAYNFIKNGRFIQNASISDNYGYGNGRPLEPVPSGGPGSGKIWNIAYEGEVTVGINENYTLKSSGTVCPVQMGDDLFVEQIGGLQGGVYPITVSIMPSLNTDNLVQGMQSFVRDLNGGLLSESGVTCIEINGVVYSPRSIENKWAVLSEDGSYITLTLQSTFKPPLEINTYYDYIIEFKQAEEAKTVRPRTLITNGSVQKYLYQAPVAASGQAVDSPIRFYIQDSGDWKTVTYYHYWVYSDGSVRAFYTTDSVIFTGFTTNRPFRLYSNFYNSNWYFFQSRSTPTLGLQVKISPDASDYNPFVSDMVLSTRRLQLKGSYSQIDSIGVRYHFWTIDQIFENNETRQLFKSDFIYNSDFTYIYEPLEAKANYMITFTIVNQEEVATSISYPFSTNVTLVDIDTQCEATVNEDLHFSEISWTNGLSSEPEGKPEVEYDNHIGVGRTERDATIEEPITYSTIGGTPLSIPKDNFALQIGLVIEDAAEDGFYDSDILSLGLENGSFVIRKTELDMDYPEFKLLEDTEGQINSISKANYYLGKNYIWDETGNKEWKDEYYWVETQSNTNCYYYQFAIKKDEVRVRRTAFWNIKENNFSISGANLTVPYNPLLASLDKSNLKVRIDNGVEGSEDTEYSVSDIPSEVNDLTMTLTLNPAPVGNIKQIVIYEYHDVEQGDHYIEFNKDIDITSNIESITIGSKVYAFYLTIYNTYTDDDDLPADPAFGIKPSWDNVPNPLINVTFNGSLISSKQSTISGEILGYQVYRRKWEVINEIINQNGEKEYVYNLIYTRLIGTFNLSDEGLATSPKFKFIDWTIENRGIFDYLIIPIATSSSTEMNIESKGKIVTDWYGWSFTSFNDFPTGHCEPVERWLFKLNIESNGYSHQTNKLFHQGFNRYPKASIGTTNYITTGLSCLIGNIDKELKYIDYFKPTQGYVNDNIQKIEKWENFSNESNLILIKDYKGRAFIGIIDNNAMSFQDIVVEILTQLSFDVTQVDDVANYQIFSVEGEI